MYDALQEACQALRNERAERGEAQDHTERAIHRLIVNKIKKIWEKGRCDDEPVKTTQDGGGNFEGGRREGVDRP